MADEAQLAFLKQGAEAWNQWLNNNVNPQIDINLSGANLRGANLNGSDLRGANLSSANLGYAALSGAALSGADLSFAALSGADLSGADLRNADLQYSDLSAAKLIGAILRGADLSAAKPIGANLSGADLIGANLNFANLIGADLRTADLRNADLRTADLRNADFRNAIISDQTEISSRWRLVHQIVTDGWEGQDLSGADLSFADLSFADLSGADLSGADLRNAIISDQTKISSKWRLVHQIVTDGWEGQDLIGADLSGANLSGADLSGADLSGADLSGADFRNAGLSANLIGADLIGADLIGADLIGADLSRADLRNAIISDQTKISSRWRLVHQIVTDGWEGQDLRGADLSGANLKNMNLSGADLSGADLSGADLSGADLSNVNFVLGRATHTDFSQADMTGVCILDWHINSETNFEGTKCDFIYRGYDGRQGEYTTRLPISSDQTFKDGEFSDWIKIQAEARKTIDLTFIDGIDWQAFFQSLNGVREKHPDASVGLQAIEKKGSAFVIRLETDPEVDQGAIESTQKELYETQLQLREAQGEIRVLREMSDVLKQLAGRPMTTNEFHFNDKVGNVAGTNKGEMKAVQNNYAGEIRQTPAESAKEIQDLLIQLQATNPADIQSLVEETIKNDPTKRKRLKNALKEGGLESMKVIFPVAGIAIETVRGWVEAEGD